MSEKKTYEEINAKIQQGSAVVLTAEEVSKLSETMKPEEIVKKVDVVTTATFGPMCSSGAFINFGHTSPPLKMQKIWLNDVPVFGGVAAVDGYIGATELSEHDENYGGAHVIQDLVEGKNIKMKATGKGTDCYPRKEIETWINKDSVNEIFLFNPRNAYQNYAVAVNNSDKTLYTYMGILLPHLGNATYSTSGELSPLLNDPELLTIGIGTRIFLCGAQGFVAWNGTQFHTTRPRAENGIPKLPGATLSVIGNLKEMSPEFISAAVYEKYGVSLFVGIGIPIPVLNEDIARFVSVKNRDIKTTVKDYSVPGCPAICETDYEKLMSGEIQVNGKTLRTAPLSSLNKARVIAEKLKTSIKQGEFQLTQPVQALPRQTSLKGLQIVGGAK